jgi:hypothetical protein
VSGQGWSRVLAVLFAPGQTFRALVERPTWLPPLLCLVLAATAFGLVATPKLDYGATIREALEGRGVAMDESAVETRSRSWSVSAGCSACSARVFVEREGEAKQTPVEVGLADATHLEILSGLDESDSVVTGPYRALRDLRDGDRIRPKEPATEDEERSTPDRPRARPA